jgi:anti-anti-sigma regulatory factor
MSDSGFNEMRETTAGMPGSGGVHLLPQMLDLVQATHLRDDMMRLAGAGGLLLDASAVERMSTPCAQVLLAAARAAQASKESFKITNASETFRTAIAELGLQSEFSNWME